MGLTQSVPEDEGCEATPIYIDFYQILGVEKNSTDQEIRQRYHELSKSFHPDKQPNQELLSPSNQTPSQSPFAPSESPSPATPQSTPTTTTATFGPQFNPGLPGDTTKDIDQAKLNVAYRHLTDPILRAYFDYMSGYRHPNVPIPVRKQSFHQVKIQHTQELIDQYEREMIQSQQHHYALQGEKRLQANANSRGRDFSIQSTDSFSAPPPTKRRPNQREDAKKLVILEAWYGDIVNAKQRFAPSKGKMLNVTLALRRLQGGNNLIELSPVELDLFYNVPPTFAFVEGFYDPNFLTEDWFGDTRLYVRYAYGDDLYECYVHDHEPLLLPNMDHFVDEDDRVYYCDRTDDNCYKNTVELVDPDEFNPVVAQQRGDDGFGANLQDSLFIPDQPKFSEQFSRYISAFDSLRDTQEPIQQSNLTQSTVSVSSHLAMRQSAHDIADQTPTPLHSSESSSFSTISQTSASILSCIPPHLRDKPLYSRQGVPLSFHTWETKMQAVKAKRRQVLYLGLTTIFTAIFSWLQYSGVINVFAWGERLHQKGLNLLEHVAERRRKTYEREDI